MERRAFISLLGGAAAAWPLAARAQQRDRVRRVGVVMAYAESDPTTQAWIAALGQGLGQAGWAVDRNLQIDYRWASGDLERIRRVANELVAVKPDVILAVTTPVTAALQRETSKIPIIFVIVSDPVGAGFVASLARPGGNITGFINIEESMGGKWLELLKEAAPIRHAAIMFNPDTAPGGGGYFLHPFEAASQVLGIKTIPVPVRSPTEIESAIGNLAGEPGGGLVVMTDSFMFVHRKQVMMLTESHKLPVIFPSGAQAREGGLLGYGPEYPDLFRRSASYVDRILKGENPATLPVQIPTKFELVINLKAAKALGLDIPWFLQQRADEVIE
jgi:ABC-type uncharacterized transport system substrate-binding protein